MAGCCTSQSAQYWFWPLCCRRALQATSDWEQLTATLEADKALVTELGWVRRQAQTAHAGQVTSSNRPSLTGARPAAGLAAVGSLAQLPACCCC
jgi:hypothetical protein